MYTKTMNAYPMWKRCFDHQPCNLDAHMDAEVWALLLVEKMVSRESYGSLTTPTLVEAGGRYPGFYSLDDREDARRDICV